MCKKAVERLLLSSLFLFPLSARAQHEVARLPDLLAEASRRNPELQAARQRWEGATKLPSQAGSLPDPRISVRDFGVGQPFSTLNTSNFAFVSLAVSQEIPFPGKLGLKEAMAREETRMEEQRYRYLELDVRSRVKQAYYDYFYFAKALDTIARTRELLLRFQKIAEARYAVGRGIQQDVLRSQLELSLLRDREETLDQQRASAQAKISTLLDRSPDAALGPPEEIVQSPFPGELAELYRKLQENSPALRAQEHSVSRSAFALNLARKEYMPDFRAAFEWQHTGSQFRDYYVAAFEARIPLYFWRKQRLGVEEASSRLIESRYDQRATAQDQLFQVKDHFLQARAADRLLNLYKTAVIPQATFTLESAISGYEVGSVDFLTLINTAVVLLNYELEYYAQLAAYEKALARMEPTLGVRLTP